MPDISFNKYAHQQLLETFNFSKSFKLQHSDHWAEQWHQNTTTPKKKLKEGYSETIFLQDTRYQLYSRQLNWLSVQDDSITTQFLDETGNIENNQVLLPKHLVADLLECFHENANK